jgi:hypothetical protein
MTWYNPASWLRKAPVEPASASTTPEGTQETFIALHAAESLLGALANDQAARVLELEASMRNADSPSHKIKLGARRDETVMWLQQTQDALVKLTLFKQE